MSQPNDRSTKNNDLDDLDANDSYRPTSFWSVLTGYILRQRFIVLSIIVLILLLSVLVHPFDHLLSQDSTTHTLRHPISVAAIPNLGENQQILLTEWPGRSPKEIEDQITYPLTTQLLGLSGVKTLRSSSLFGFSSIYVIFEEDKSEEWARTRLLETLASLPAASLPQGVKPQLGPDATALGQVFWYVLEGIDSQGEVTNAWDLEELRTIQDWQVRFALEKVEGVAEVASIGGYVKEYVIEADPQKLAQYQLTLSDLVSAAKASNLDVGARSFEINQVEHLIRGVGQVKSIEDLNKAIIPASLDKRLSLGEVAHIFAAPALRRGALDIGGAESVGGIVVTRSHANPLTVIKNLKKAIKDLNLALPHKRLSSGTQVQVQLRSIYDRSQLINETLATLSSALSQQLLITLIVVLAFLGSLSSAFLISLILPLALALTFLLMWLFNIQANMMSLAGIAIAIGTMVDMGIILVERIHRAYHNDRLATWTSLDKIKFAVGEVAPAITTSAFTTLLSFLPVFALGAAEGKLFHPLAQTKSFALLSALILALTVLPVLISFVWHTNNSSSLPIKSSHLLDRFSSCVEFPIWLMKLFQLCIFLVLIYFLSCSWTPLGHEAGSFQAWVNLFVIIMAFLLPLFFFIRSYSTVLSWALHRPLLALSLPLITVFFGALCWLGVEQKTSVTLHKIFPGLGSEFMPAFDEGEFIYMPTLMPHTSFGEALRVLRRLDADLEAIPEVKYAVGKLGRAESALDPAPISMFEVLISYISEYEITPKGERKRLWRDHIKSPADIWSEIIKVAQRPGLTSAPLLMPIQTRQVMLQSGMRAPMGLKLQGESLERLEQAGAYLEKLIKQVKGIQPKSVFAEKIVGKPYLEFHVKRDALLQYGLTVTQAQQALSQALAGEQAGTMLLGRQRFAIRVRGSRQYRESIAALKELPVAINQRGDTIPLSLLSDLKYIHGPQVMKAEDGQLTTYLTFGLRAQEKRSASQVMEAVLNKIAYLRQQSQQAQAQALLKNQVSIDQAQVGLDPLAGILISPEGQYKSQERSNASLKLLVPIAFLLILVVLGIQFRHKSTIAMIYAGVLVALSGAFTLLWLYQQPWFLNVSIFGVDLRSLFQIEQVNLSVAVWVGMIALLGIATDDGVVMASALEQRLSQETLTDVTQLKILVIQEASARLIPCLMTTATTLIALLPVIMSAGRGADLMRPMALPSFGGMCLELLTLFVVPLLFYSREKRKLT